MSDEENANAVESDEVTDAVEPATGEDADAPEESSEEGSAEYWKRLKRETDNRNKRLTRELETLRRESMSEQERAIEEARDTARAEVMREVSGQLVDAEVRSAAGNRPLNVDTLLNNLDRTKFLDEDGNVDREAVTAFLDELAPVASEPRYASDLGQGTRGATRSSPADVFGQLITGSLK